PEPQNATQSWDVNLDFVGANPNVQPRGEEPTQAVFSYFQGSKDQWKTGLKGYSKVVYPDLWPGIDLIYTGTSNQLKYTFLVKPGADPDNIRLAYRGTSSVELNDAGQLEVMTPLGGFRDATPYSYQEAGGRREEVPTRYVFSSRRPSRTVYRFHLGQ